MTSYQMIALILTVAAVFSYLNYRYIKLPMTIGLMLVSLVASVLMLAVDQLGLGLEAWAIGILEHIDFSHALMDGMLSFLLFAGALHINLNDLKKNKFVIGLLASIGVVLSTCIVGSLSYWIFGLLGVEVPFVLCLLFGALVSPTDPIAVMGILKQTKISKSLETKITGESLFNDGVAVVVFLVLLSVVRSGGEVEASSVVILFVQEVLGGIVLGLLLGYGTYSLIRKVDHYSVEILLTLALVTGGYAVAQAFHISGPIVIVVAGLLLGNQGREFAMSKTSREHLDHFWEFVDEILNAILFVLIGLELLVLKLEAIYVAAGLLMFLVAIFSRFVSVGTVVAGLRRYRRFSPHVTKILTWGGVRGGISIALALSLPKSEYRELLITATYVVVILSILVQGLSLKGVVMALEKES